jgi:hypothetical protein
MRAGARAESHCCRCLPQRQHPAAVTLCICQQLPAGTLTSSTPPSLAPPPTKHACAAHTHLHQLRVLEQHPRPVRCRRPCGLPAWLQLTRAGAAAAGD